ncbi:methionine aminotransferase [Crocinitomix algicola]|uniref:methionine aminotransferase n=1 Tax=Crocinitomix algicola TaxID=1740263 RepID=UPI0008732037|nr:methionine aminotransferase [Crocinitomix algicola]
MSIINTKLPNVGSTIFSVMSQLAQEHNAINLSQGFPDFEIDPLLKTYIVEAMNENQVQYAPAAGRLDLRIAIANSIHVNYNVVVNPKEEITVVAGATQGIYTTIAALVNEGDEVIVFDPAYDCYDPAIRVHKGIPVHINLNSEDFSINWNELNEKVSDKTKLIIVNNPHNPSGAVWNENDMLELRKLLSKHPQLFVLSDEVYEYITFKNQHQSLLQDDLIRTRTFVASSFGKSLHVTGWKLGYVIAPKELTKEFRKIHQYLVFCANNTMQYGVAKYLVNGPDLSQIAAIYLKKRDLFLKGIENSRFKPLVCEGTYFVLLDYSEISDLSDVEFAKLMTTKYGVASIPISVFYEDGRDDKRIRICFAKEDETLIKASKLLCKI